MNLQRGGRLVATLTIVGITPSADQSLRDYLLDIGIQIEPIRQEQPATGCVVVIEGVSADVFVRSSDNSLFYIGHARPRDGLIRQEFNLDDDGKPRFTLLFELFSQRLEALEALRRGQDLSLRLRLSARFHYKFAGQTGKSFDGVVTGNLDYAIPQGAWVRDVLDPLQYTNTLLIEVPLTRKSAGTPQLEVALQRFKEAQDARIAGDDRGAVAKCREAFDA